MPPWYWFLILLAGATLGGIVGWLLSPLLVPGPFSGFLGIALVPVTAWIALLANCPAARLMDQWMRRRTMG
jgi:hypothetical protein